MPLGCVEGKYWVTVRGEVKHGEEFCRQDAVVRKGPFDMPPVKRRVEGSWDLW